MAGFQVSMYGRFWVSTEGQRDHETWSGFRHRYSGYEPHTADERYRDRETLHIEGSVAALGRAGQVRLLLDNLTGDALVAGRTTGLVRSAWARLSSSRIAFS